MTNLLYPGAIVEVDDRVGIVLLRNAERHDDHNGKYMFTKHWYQVLVGMSKVWLVEHRGKLRSFGTPRKVKRIE